MKTDKLKNLNVCCDAIEWVATQRNYKEAWQNCERGDWMLWLAKQLKVDDRKLTLANFKCANQVRHLMKDKRSIVALDAAEKYGNGEINREELNAVAVDAAAAAYAAAAYADAYADAAAYAAYAAAAYTANVFTGDIVRKESLKKSADICRDILTEEVLTAYKKMKL